MNKKLLYLSLFFAIIFKFIFNYLILKNQILDASTFFGNFSADSEGYLMPIDRYWASGEFYSEHRMPGYSVLYFLLTLFFDKDVSLNLLVIIQVVLSGISSTLLALLAFQWTKRLVYFFSTFFIVLLSTYISWYDGFILTESLTISILVLFVYSFDYAQNKRKPTFWMSIPGLLFAWIVFLRPVFFPIIIIFIFLIVFKNRLDYIFILKSTFFILLPFLILDGIWIYSNYQRHKKIIPFQETFLGPTQSNVFYEPAFRFVQSWGGDYVWWKEGSHIRFFGVGTDSLVYSDKDQIQFPEYIFTSEYNLDSLKLMNEKLMDLKKAKLDSSDFLEAESQKVYESFNRFSNSIKREKPWVYHVKSRISLVHQFLFKSKARNPYYSVGIPNIFIKIKSYTYILTLIMGYLSSFFLIFRIRGNINYIMISGVVWYTFIIHPLILRVIENRYLLPSYPFLILAITLSVYELNKIYRSEKI
jgi:hypothetical protein